MWTFPLERISGDAALFKPQPGFGLRDLLIHLEACGVVPPQPLVLVPVRARTTDILNSGDQRLPLGDDLHPFTQTRLAMVRTVAEERGAVDDLVYAYISPGSGVLLDGTHRTIIARERGQEFLNGHAVRA